MRIDAERPDRGDGGITTAPDRAAAARATPLDLVRSFRLDRLPTAWQRALIAALALRGAIAIASFVFGGMLEGLPPVDVEPVFGTGFDGWRARSPQQQDLGLLGAGIERFDALWYLAIAEQGYPSLTPSGSIPGAIAFFPGFPLLVGILGRLLLGRFYLAGSLVALAATVAALAGVHRLVEEETDDQQLAGRALVALAVFPSAFFLVAPYSEALFLALTAWALVWARRGAWGRVALLAAGAALTRNLGIVLAVPLLLEAVRQVREGRRPPRTAWAAGLLGAPAGLALFAGYSWLRYDTPFAPVLAQISWERQWELPTSALGRAWRFGTQSPGDFPSGYHSMDLLVFLVVAAAVVWLLWRTPLPYGAYAAIHVAVWLVYPFPGRPLMSTYRFALAIAPLAWAFGAWTKRPAVAAAWRACSAGLMGALLLLFVNWFYVF